MTTQEAIALSAERQDNLKYRKKIQRIKNSIAVALAGGFLGGGLGAFKDFESAGILNQATGKTGSKNKILGALIGSGLGGLAGYGFTRLKENYDESAGLDPTLTNFVVNYNNNKQASSDLEKKAFFATIGRLIGTGGSSLGRGIGSLLSTTGRLTGEVGKFSARKLKRIIELIAGGDKSTLSKYETLRKMMRQNISDARILGKDTKPLKKELSKMEDAFLRGDKSKTFRVRTGGGKVVSLKPTKEISDELGKIIAARTAAGAGIIGGGYALKKHNDEKNKKWF